MGLSLQKTSILVRVKVPDPQAHVLENAAQWVRDLLLGQMGTAIAVLAIAIIGIRMIQGHVSPRESVRVLLGCFLLFGSVQVAKGLMGMALGAGQASPVVEVSAPSYVQTPALPVSPTTVNPFDPYAGASVPN